MPLSSRHASTHQAPTVPAMASQEVVQADRPAAKNAAICPTDDDSITPSRDAPPRAKVERQSTEYVIKSGIAGGLAGCAAKTVVGPLDRVKILFQTSNPQFQKYTGSWFGVVSAMKKIYRSNGPKGLFRGHSATLLRIFPYAGIKFLAYEQVRAVVIRDPSQETPIRRFMSGSLAGSLSVFFTYPLEVVRVRLAFDTTREGSRSSLSTVCREIYHEKAPAPPNPSTSAHLNGTNLASVAPRTAAMADAATATVQQLAPRSGLSNFYRGFTPTMLGMLPYAGSSFLTHDYAQDLLRHPSIAKYTTLARTAKLSKDTARRPAQLTSWAQLLAGGVAGFVSQTVSYPLEVIRRRMQVGGVVGDGRRLGIAEVAGRIWIEKGWRGFFVGLGIGYAKVVPMAATSFYVYERGKYYLGI